jgi:hypothetical protein
MTATSERYGIYTQQDGRDGLEQVTRDGRGNNQSSSKSKCPFNEGGDRFSLRAGFSRRMGQV